MRKRFLITVLALAMSISMLAGCGKSEDDDTSVALGNRTDLSQEDSASTKDRTESENNSIASEENDSSENTPETLPETAIDDHTGTDHETDEDVSQPVKDSSEASVPSEANTAAPSVPANNGATNPGAVSADDYRHDIKEFNKLNDSELLEIDDDDDIDAMFTYLYTSINGLSLKTPEGLAIKTDFLQLFQLLEDIETMDIMDEDAFDALFEQALTIEANLEEHLNAFAAAARAAGLSENELAGLSL